MGLTPPAAFVDAEGAVRAWINLQDQLVGQNAPLALGCHLQHLRGKPQGCYAVLTLIDSFDDPGDLPMSYARVSASIYGGQRQKTAIAAAAYANAIRTLQGSPVVLTVERDGTPLLVPCTLQAADTITGPRFYPDGLEDTYLVDAVFMLTPAP